MGLLGRPAAAAAVDVLHHRSSIPSSTGVLSADEERGGGDTPPQARPPTARRQSRLQPLPLSCRRHQEGRARLPRRRRRRRRRQSRRLTAAEPSPPARMSSSGSDRADPGARVRFGRTTASSAGPASRESLRRRLRASSLLLGAGPTLLRADGAAAIWARRTSHASTSRAKAATRWLQHRMKSAMGERGVGDLVNSRARVAISNRARSCRRGRP